MNHGFTLPFRGLLACSERRGALWDDLVPPVAESAANAGSGLHARSTTLAEPTSRHGSQLCNFGRTHIQAWIPTLQLWQNPHPGMDPGSAHSAEQATRPDPASATFCRALLRPKPTDRLRAPLPLNTPPVRPPPPHDRPQRLLTPKAKPLRLTARAPTVTAPLPDPAGHHKRTRRASPDRTSVLPKSSARPI